MVECVDAEESPEKERNGAFPVSSIKGCFEEGRRCNERVCG